jgi:predicted DNA-binding transcriptional regulator YafY
MPGRHRQPTYPAAINFAKIVYDLFLTPIGISFARLSERFGLSERTIARYADELAEKLTDDVGRPIIEISGAGASRRLRLVGAGMRSEGTAYQAASLYFAFRTLEFLRKTVIGEGIEHFWDEALKTLETPAQLRLKDIERKFHVVPYAPKDYGPHEEKIDLILRALLMQRRLRLTYRRAAGGAPREHRFAPFTLVEYRGGLYLLGRSDQGPGVIYLAVERIEAVEFDHDANGDPTHFALPRGYKPEKYTDGAFGLMDGPVTEVELLVRSDDSLPYLQSRAIHPTQRFVRRRDGRIVLKMRVRGTTELRNWIMSFGPWLEVLRPAALRAEIAQLHREALAACERPAAPDAGRRASRTYRDPLSRAIARR